MNETLDMEKLVAYAAMLAGDEKGEAQVFCDRLFQAFGHKGYKEAGATLEFRIKKGDQKNPSFADLIWKPRVLLEMKKRGTNLTTHYKQAFDYWIHAVPNRPRYVVLCNFDEFRIYDFDKQIVEPVDIVAVTDLPKRYTTLNFLFPSDPKPIFGNDREAVSRDTADKIARLFNSLIRRKVSREQAQRFILQLVVAMFAEDIDLLPSGMVFGIIDDCLNNNQSAYDLLGGLFEQMNSQEPAAGGKFQKVPYFNGGLFSQIKPVELDGIQLLWLGGKEGAARQDWSKVNPAIFGTLFQHSMGKEERHAHGAHYTSEADIMRIVNPTIVDPFQARIDSASTAEALFDLRTNLLSFRVLDPACGSGNFLYLSYREMVRLEIRLIEKLKTLISKSEFEKKVKAISLISPKQFFGIDRDSFGVELAKVTLMLAKKLALNEAAERLQQDQIAYVFDDALPLDNLDTNFICGDALLSDWPASNVVIGNPPYQSKNKIQQELGRDYVNEIREKFPDVDGRADYCVYWFRKAHDHLKEGQRAGLVGTNTVRQNYSRVGGLDYIVSNGGTITNAVSTMKWSGDAAVDVSIVNWVKGPEPGKKKLFIQEGTDVSNGWRYESLESVPSSLSFGFDVTQAKTLKANAVRGGCFQGQTHGHDSFLMTVMEGKAEIEADKKSQEVLFPFLIGNDLIGNKGSLPKRCVIDFQPRDIHAAAQYKRLFSRIEKNVLPERQKAAEEEKERNKKALKANPNAKINHHHENFLKHWWLMSYPREDMIETIEKIPRYITCACVTLRPIFEFVSKKIRPNAALMVFPYADDYSFGILQSYQHWVWFTNRCSTLTGRPRYTSNTVFDSFPWPQEATIDDVKEIAACAVSLRKTRAELIKKHSYTLRKLYRTLDVPGENELKDAHVKLDKAVARAYGAPADADMLRFLLELNLSVAAREAMNKKVTGPGLPPIVKNPKDFITTDCVRMPDWAA